MGASIAVNMSGIDFRGVRFRPSKEVSLSIYSDPHYCYIMVSLYHGDTFLAGFDYKFSTYEDRENFLNKAVECGFVKTNNGYVMNGESEGER